MFQRSFSTKVGIKNTRQIKNGDELRQINSQMTAMIYMLCFLPHFNYYFYLIFKKMQSSYPVTKARQISWHLQPFLKYRSRSSLMYAQKYIKALLQFTVNS